MLVVRRARITRAESRPRQAMQSCQVGHENCKPKYKPTMRHAVASLCGGTFGDFEYRKFRLYLWGATYEFMSRSLDCYRTIRY
jgi:hypothetical protein